MAEKSAGLDYRRRGEFKMTEENKEVSLSSQSIDYLRSRGEIVTFEQNKEVLLQSEDIKELGHRLSAVHDIVQLFNQQQNTTDRDVYNLLAKELDDVATILMNVDHEGILKELTV